MFKFLTIAFIVIIFIALFLLVIYIRTIPKKERDEIIREAHKNTL